MIEVTFRPCGKIYYYDPGELKLQVRDRVVVESPRGQELGYVVRTGVSISDPELLKEVKPVIRKVTAQDLKNYYDNHLKARRAFKIALEKIKIHKLSMKLVEVNYTIDGGKIIFYFTAAGRVDFRELVKDLAQTFKKRIELHQIGVRDEAKLVGSLGPCGQQICCHQFMREFTPVSIKMAKTQNLTLNPIKISGACGRLICCLAFEQEIYQETLKNLPRIGEEVETNDGKRGIVVDINVPREKVVVEFESNVRLEFKASQIHPVK